MTAPIRFADLFVRRIKFNAEARGETFVAIYSFGMTAGWDFPRDATQAHYRLRAARQIGQQAIIFKRQPDGDWRTWATINIPNSITAYS